MAEPLLETHLNGRLFRQHYGYCEDGRCSACKPRKDRRPTHGPYWFEYVDLESGRTVKRRVDELPAEVPTPVPRFRRAKKAVEAAKPLWKTYISGKTYREEYVRCGNRRCSACKERPTHGPYWFEYSRDWTGRLRKRYTLGPPAEAPTPVLQSPRARRITP